jgi:uncharacterized protein (TIGR03083 family)
VDATGYLAALHRESDRFARAAQLARERSGWEARVPGCPDWTLADLVWHLTEVQDFWAWVVRTRAADPSGYRQPDRLADDALPAALQERSRELETVLDGADPATRVWTWAARQDVAFVLRRQAQEAVVHRVDAEQVAGQVTPIDADLALDGLDEWLELMVPAAFPGGLPAGAAPVVFHATDADAERTLFAEVDDLPLAALTGSAGDLLLVAWRRLPLDAVTVDGDAARAAELLGSVSLG